MSARRLAAALAVVLAVAAITGCGVPLDSSPRAVVAATTTTTSDGEPAVNEEGDSTAFLYFIANNQLINLDQDIPSRRPTDVLTALFSGVPIGASKDVVSQIPTGTRLLGAEQSGTVLDVNVSKDFDNLVGAGRAQATAQIVMTATDLSGIDEVSLRIEGQPTQVFSQVRGDADRVGACDYIGLLPTEDVLATWPLDRKSQRHLTTRRNMLDAQCPQAPAAGN